jgi:glycosyltransferase involved in cell wall biosynthesis
VADGQPIPGEQDDVHGGCNLGIFLRRMTLRVLQVLHQGGGAGSVTSTLHLSLGLARAGVAVRFACPPGSQVEAEARARGLEVLPLGLEPGAGRSNAAALAGLLARHPVDLVNSQSARDRHALTRLALRRRLGVPLVMTRRQMPRTFVLENWLAGRVAAQVIAVSRAVAEALKRKGTPPRKLTVIPNGLVSERVDLPVTSGAVSQWRERIGWTPGQRTIGIVARRKDQRVVLAALPRVATPVRLVLVGIEPAGPLADLAREVGPPHAAVCLPFTPDVRPLYELLDLVLLPSRSEGLSQGLLEAMALGKPVVASAAGGNLDLIAPDVDGLLVPGLSPGAWARAIDHLLTDPDDARRLGTAARRTARESFSLERTIASTIELYERVLGAGPLAPAPRSG